MGMEGVYGRDYHYIFDIDLGTDFTAETLLGENQQKAAVWVVALGSGPAIDTGAGLRTRW